MLNFKLPGRVTRTLIITFSVFAVIITGIGILVYRDLESRTKLNAHSTLSSLSRVKVREVINWRKERINDANFIYSNDHFKEHVLEYMNNMSDTNAKSRIMEFIRPLKNSHEYIEVLLIDPSGRKYPLFTNKADQLLDQDIEYFRKSIRERRIILSDINRHKDIPDNKIHMSSFIPLFLSESAKVFCVIEIKIDPAKILFPAIQLSSDNNKTSETFLVRREGNNVVFINNLKYKDNAALEFSLPLTMHELPAAMAVLGRIGIFEGKDYRGVTVIADLQSIPDSPWYIVSKIDQDELYSPLKTGSVIVTGSVLVLILLCGLIVYALRKHEQLKYFEQTVKSDLEKEILQKRIDFLIKNANDIVILSDDYGKIVQANDKAILSYGYTAKEFAELRIVDIRAEHTRGDVERDKEKVRKYDGYIFETVHMKKDGTEFPVEVSSRIIEIQGKEFYQSIIRDISERKAYEEKLKSTIFELNRSNRDLEQFAYVASHDLQEPLRMVHTFAQLLERKNKDKLDDNSKEYIGFLTDGALRMQQLIQALLDYSRINSSSKTFEEVDLSKAVERALENLSLQIKESKAIISCQSLPSLQADFTQMVQLFQNLLSNSIKYSGKNAPQIKIRVESNSRDYLFSVEDNGIGIHEEYFDKIFMIFQRLNEREKYEGTGIGLTICKKIVENHGGRIWVKSVEGIGSTFYFTLART